MKIISCFLIFLFAHGTHPKKVDIFKVDVDVDPKYFKVWNQLRQEGDSNVVDLDLNVLEGADDIDVRVAIFKNCTDHSELFFRSDVLHGCHEKDVTDNILMFIFKQLAKYGNITAACPLKMGHYTLRGFKIDEKELPGDLPDGNYRADFQVSRKIKEHDFPIYTDRYYFSSG